MRGQGLRLPAHPRIELPLHPGQRRNLRGGAVHGHALLFQHGGLLSDLIGQGLEHRELVLDIGNGGRRLIDRLHLPLHPLHPPNHILQLAGGRLEVLIEVLQP